MIGLKKLAPLFHPIRSKTKTNRSSLALVFPRFTSATFNYFEVLIGSLDCDWLIDSFVIGWSDYFGCGLTALN